MKFLIAGYGSIGRRHMRNLLALGEKDILLYRTHHSTLPDDELAGYCVETDIRAALAHKPDGVIVSNPTSLHMDVAIPAAEMGCSILLEKPIAQNLDRVEELKTALKKGGGKLVTAFQFRFHPGLQKVKQLLVEGTIGRPLEARAQWGEYLPGWHPWEDYRASYASRSDLGGGVALTLCHPLDYLQWMFGKAQVLWSFGDKISDLEIQMEDMVEIGMRFPLGTVGSVHLNYFQQPGVHRLEILGASGTILWDNADGAVSVFTTASGKWEKIPAPEGFERNHLFLAETQHFLDVMQGKAEPLCTLEDGISALELALTASKMKK